jgi:transposase InsO family protein
MTDNGREFCGTEQHPYELYLELNDIKHRRTMVRHPQTNGFFERFNRTMLDEFFSVKMREKMYSSFASLQTDFDQWFQFYNEQRPHLCYRNHGKKPIERIHDFKYLFSMAL